MTRQILVDSNVLIYANIATAPMHGQAQSKLQDLWQNGDDLWISRQIIRKYAVALTRPQTFSQPTLPNIVTIQIQHFLRIFKVADDTSFVTTELLNLMKSVSIGGKKIHDANLVATMLTYNITHLLTNNVGDFTRFSRLITIISL